MANVGRSCFLLGIAVVAIGLAMMYFPLGVLFVGIFLSLCGGLTIYEEGKKRLKKEARHGADRKTQTAAEPA